jgi:uncharacterized membrane protein YdbT with pleckstrin-like domain
VACVVVVARGGATASGGAPEYREQAMPRRALKALAAFLLPPLAPFVARRVGFPRLAWAWVATLVLYVVALGIFAA